MAKTLVIFDTETDGGFNDKRKFEVERFEDNRANVIQYACIALDTQKIEYIPNSEFFTWVLPEDIEDENYIQNHFDTLKWHADLRNIKIEEFVQQIKDNGISQKLALENFSEHIRKFGPPKSPPGAAGQNILGFDLPIVECLCKKYKVKFPFSNKWQTHWDLLEITTKWFQYAEQPPRSLSMDSLRDWFRLEDPKGQNHDAYSDILHEGYFIKRFMNLHKEMIKRIPNLNKRPKESVTI